MKEIRGDAKNISTLLGGTKYAIDFYQREYRWEKKQITELIDDLSEKFIDSHEEDNERTAVEKYGHYFLGSIIISDKDGHKYIIDGQQRLTSLTLLLIYIHGQLDEEDKEQFANLIFSKKYGERSFNLDVEERTECMNALFTGKPLNDDDLTESVANILERYQDIEEYFPEELSGHTLPFFADWLIENVFLVEITAYSETDAYTIFETMNDRGLSLTPTDMLKGYLLANITNPNDRVRSNKTWRRCITDLQEIGKEEDADAIKAWLRSQYANSQRPRGTGDLPQDFERIGTEFHRWVRDYKQELKLTSPSEFSRFIEQDFAFYAKWYIRIRQAAQKLTEGMETVFYNAQNNFTLQYSVLLAPIQNNDNDSDIQRKIRITAGYIDIVIARRIWNGKSTSYSNMQYNMFGLIIKKIRNKSPTELADFLTAQLEDEDDFNCNERFSLNKMNGKYIHLLLARMTDYCERLSERKSRYEDYITRRGKNGYEIEHIWANHFEQHSHEFDHQATFEEYRNRIGGLLLLPKSFNASYGDSPYEDKRKHYIKHNLLAQSLHEMAYENDPGFKQFVKKSGLAFQSHEKFEKDDFDARQSLYQRLAEQIWNPDNLIQEAKA